MKVKPLKQLIKLNPLKAHMNLNIMGWFISLPTFKTHWPIFAHFWARWPLKKLLKSTNKKNRVKIIKLLSEKIKWCEIKKWTYTYAKIKVNYKKFVKRKLAKSYVTQFKELSLFNIFFYFVSTARKASKLRG